MKLGTPRFRWLILCLLPACQDRAPTAPGHGLAGPPLVAPASSAASAGDGLHFLPPLVREPALSGDFDGSLSPVVEICRPLARGCSLPLVARFTTAGRGSERVRVDAKEQHYIVNWHTREFRLDPAQLYRIRVRVGTSTLGHIDVRMVESGREGRDPGGAVLVRQGSTVPIKFRIEQGAVPATGPSAVRIAEPGRVGRQIGPAGGTVTSTVDGVRYTLSVPAGALMDDIPVTLAPLASASNFPLSGGLGAGVDLQPQGLVFLRPATLEIAFADGTELGPVVGFGYGGSGADLHPYPARIDGSVVRLSVTHFSG